MVLRYFFTVIAVLGMGTSAYAVPVQTTYSYVGADYTYQPGSQFTFDGNPYPKPGTDYAAILGPRLTATITIDGDTSGATGVYSSGYDYNPVGYRGILEASFNSGQVTFSSSMLTFTPFPFSITLVNGVVTGWSYFSNFGDLSSCGVGPFCAPGYLQMSNTFGDYIRFSIPYPGANYGAEARTPGTWSLEGVSPVPGPIAGAGLPGLLMAIAGFIGWRRIRHTITA